MKSNKGRIIRVRGLIISISALMKQISVLIEPNIKSPPTGGLLLYTIGIPSNTGRAAQPFQNGNPRYATRRGT